MKKTVFLLVSLMFSVLIYAQGTYTKVCNDKSLVRKSAKWARKGDK